MRRGQQLISHYRKIWQDKDLIQFLMRIRKQVTKVFDLVLFAELIKPRSEFLQWIHTKGFLMASIPFAFDWNKERIPNEVIYEQLHEIDYVHQLQQGTLYCPQCSLRQMIDRRVNGIAYCGCRHSTTSTVMDDWEPYLERDNIIIWRRPQGNGQHAYKVYGRYEDVTAEDFFFVQTDVEYRKIWDKSALALDIVDSDEQTNSNVLYWELLWPVRKDCGCGDPDSHSP